MLEIDKVLSVALPDAVRVPIHYVTQRYLGRCDPMILRLHRFVARPGRSIDIGANQGLYTFRLAGLSSAVESFEPQPVCARRLQAYAKCFSHNVTVHQVALSDRDGLLELKVPTVPGKFGDVRLTGRASLTLPFDAYDAVEVRVRTLDSFAFDDVTFVKIDVEGHEHLVIDGARATLSRCRPVLLVEIEQRHLGERSLTKTFDQICDFGYTGEFYHAGRALPLTDFDEKVHQERNRGDVAGDVLAERYVNNFIFWPSERHPRTASAA